MTRLTPQAQFYTALAVCWVGWATISDDIAFWWLQALTYWVLIVLVWKYHT